MDPHVLIDRYVRNSELREYARTSGINVSDATKFDLVSALVEKLGPEESWQFLDEHLQVGRGSLHWYKLDGIKGMSPEKIEQSILEEGGESYFNSTNIPDLSSAPTIICARWQEDHNLRFYVGRERNRTIIIGLEPQLAPITHFATALVRPTEGLLEVWDNDNSAASTAREASAVMGTPGYLSYVPIIDGLDPLLKQLNAFIVSDRFRDDTGQYSVIEFVKNQSSSSLDEDTEYAENHYGKPHIRKTIGFEVPGISDPVHVQITSRGGFIFRAYTPRSVIDYVLQAIKQAHLI